MKKKIFTLAVITVFWNCQIVFAQITVPATGVFALNTDIELAQADEMNMPTIIVMDEIQHGPNAQWNFSAISADVSQQTQIMAPAQTPFGSGLPGNRVVKRAYQFQPEYLYYQNDGSRLINFGSILADGFKIDNNNGEQLVAFPIVYNQQHAGTYRQFYNYEMGYDPGVGYEADSARHRAGVVYNYMIDGWGTLITPEGTFNVLRQKVTRIVSDTADYLRTSNNEWQINAEINNWDETEVVFWSDSQPYPVMRLIDNLGFGTASQVEWLMDPVFLGQQENQLDNVSVYPNPTTAGNITVEVDEQDQNAPYKVVDRAGRIIQEGSLTGSKTSIVVAAEAGHYTIVIEGTETVKTVPFIKQ